MVLLGPASLSSDSIDGSVLGTPQDSTTYSCNNASRYTGLSMREQSTLSLGLELVPSFSKSLNPVRIAWKNESDGMYQDVTTPTRATDRPIKSGQSSWTGEI